MTLCNGNLLPTQEEENERPDEADLRYRSATKRLIEARRTATYHLLHQENAYYGFRRNLLGLKTFAMTTTLFLTGVIAVVWWHSATWQNLSIDGLLADATVRWSLYVVLLSNLVYLTLWLLMVTPRFVRQAADEYAFALFRTLD